MGGWRAGELLLHPQPTGKDAARARGSWQSWGEAAAAPGQDGGCSHSPPPHPSTESQECKMSLTGEGITNQQLFHLEGKEKGSYPRASPSETGGTHRSHPQPPHPTALYLPRYPHPHPCPCGAGAGAEPGEPPARGAPSPAQRFPPSFKSSSRAASPISPSPSPRAPSPGGRLGGGTGGTQGRQRGGCRGQG